MTAWCEICLSHLLCHSAFLSECGMALCHDFMILSTIHLYKNKSTYKNNSTYMLDQYMYIYIYIHMYRYTFIHIYIAKCWQQNVQSVCLLRWAYPIESPMGEENVATSIPFKIPIGGSNYTNPKTHHWNIAVPVSQEFASTHLPATWPHTSKRVL